MSDMIERKAAMELRDSLADIIGARPMSSIHSALSEYRKAIAALPAQPAQGEAVAPKCWWIDHGNYGQITMREDEATTAHSEGKRVIVYHPTPPASAELDALVAEARERARDEFAAGHMNDAVFHGNVADAITALRAKGVR